jgi:hypothetical protein
MRGRSGGITGGENGHHKKRSEGIMGGRRAGIMVGRSEAS